MIRKIFLTIVLCLITEQSLAVKLQESLLVVDYNGSVLFQRDASKKMYPASLVKMMTLYVVFDAIKAGNINMDDHIVISQKAAAMPRTKLGLPAGSKISVKEAVVSLIVKSCNDISVAMAENMSGTEDRFVTLMNVAAKKLGMKNTVFTNASGWHNPRQITTAYDMARLAIALRRDFPEYYHLFSRPSFYYKSILYKNHNRVIYRLEGAEGLKTGYTSHAGWNLVTSATRNDRHLIGVVMGGNSSASRDGTMIKMMNAQFNKMRSKEVVQSHKS